MTYIPNKGKVDFVTIQPYIHYEWGKYNIVFVDNKYKHPDPSKLMIWGWGLDGEIYPGDFKRQFTKVGRPYTVEYSIEGRRTANEEKMARIHAIEEFIGNYGKVIEGKYIPARERRNKPTKKKPVKKTRRWATDVHRNYENEERGSDKPFNLRELPLRELLVLYFESKGYSVVTGRSRKFITMSKPGEENNWYLGTNHAVLRGRTVSEAVSINLTQGYGNNAATKEILIKYLEKAGY